MQIYHDNDEILIYEFVIYNAENKIKIYTDLKTIRLHFKEQWRVTARISLSWHLRNREK